jgi:7-cyano-7-deazaguanine synthase
VLKKKAVVLLSGGLDSATTLALACQQGFECYALTCVYGQRHGVEVESARKVAQALGVQSHKQITIDLSLFGGSALTDRDQAVPKNRSEEVMSERIPVTYVPARNTVFLSLALAWAEVLGAYDLFIGVNAMDYSGYPDCRPDFIKAFERTANLATAAAIEGRGKFRIHTPIIAMTKSQIILRGLQLGLDYGLTHSCYDPDDQGRSCGHCDSCQLRLKGFDQAGLKDPAVYQSQ